MYRNLFKNIGLYVVVTAVCLAAPMAWGQGDQIDGASVTMITPDPLVQGSNYMCFTVNVISPDIEYMDRFDIDLPDGWTIDSQDPDSVPVANGCGGALPPVPGVDPTNMVYWQSTGYPPSTGCGAWSGGSSGTDFVFCATVTVPDGTGAPWDFAWNVYGDGYGGEPHEVAGSYGPVAYDPGTAPNDDCFAAIVVTDGAPAAAFDTTGTTFDGVGTCQSSPNIWYQYTATCTGTATIDLCGSGYDTIMAAYDGFICDPLGTEVGCNDDYCSLQSGFEIPVTAGDELLIEVGGYSGATGPGVLNIACAASGPAIALTKTVGTTPLVCAATDNITVGMGDTVTYCYAVENTGDVTFEFHSLFDDALGDVFTNDPYTLNPGDTYEVYVDAVINAPVTNTGTWTAADSVGGYIVDDQIAVDFLDISATGVSLALGDDDTAMVPFGFTFEFYGMNYTDFWVSSNGFMSDVDWGSGCCTGDPLPDPGTPNGTVAGWWEDLNPTDGGTVHYETLGTSPNQVFIMQFMDVPHYGSAEYVTMQYKFFEGTNVIEVHYLNAGSEGGTHSAGIENQDGSIGIQYYLGTDPLTTPVAVQYAPTMTQEASAMDTATVNLSDPDITVDPANIMCSQMTNEVTVHQLDLGNVGDQDLDWSVDEAPVTRIPASDGNFLRGANPPSQMAAPLGHKANPEAGAPDLSHLVRGTLAYATEASFGNHALFDSDAPETIVVVAPATGAFWAGDFVGTDLSKTYQISDTNQLVTIDIGTGAETVIGTLAAPPGAETYTGMTYDPASGNTYASSCDITTSSLLQIDVVAGTATVIGPITNSPCSIALAADDAGNLYSYDLVTDMFLSVDKATGAGTEIGSIGFDANFGQGMDYDADTSTMYMTAFNGGAFQPELRSVDLVTGNTMLLGVLGALDPADLVQLGWVAFESGSPCANPADVPWLSVAPTNGTIAPAGTQPLDVTCDSTGYAVGMYEAALCVISNDPDEPLVQVPTNLEVVIPVELMSIEIE